ncbi:MAG: lipopolysaccharide kinase InaA family protein [Sedimentisphaerales bacterium]
MYIRSQFLNHALGQVLLAGEDKWPQQDDFKTLPSSERSCVHKFTVSIDGVDREVYVKQYLFKSILHSLKCLFFSGSPARQAFNAETMLAENGFDVAQMIAMGECRDGLLQTKNFLATFGIENSVSARNYILSIREITTPQQLADWRKFIRDFGRTIGRMHARGISHGDLRLGNILVRRDDNLWRFFFIDNERTKKNTVLPFVHRVKNLVQLNMGPYGIMSSTDRMRFFAAYLAENSMSKTMTKILVKTILRRTARRLDKETRIRSWLKKSLGTNYRYLRVDAEDLTAVFLRSFCHGADPIDFLKKIDTLKKEGHTLQDDRNCFVCRLKWNGRDIVVKYYKHKGVVFALFDTIGKSHAKRDWLNGNRLGMLNMPVPQTLAFIERRRAGLVWESYIVSEHIENREPDNFMRDNNAARQNQRTY